MERTSTSLWTNNTAHSNPDATRAAVGQSSLSELCKLFLICTTVTIITTLASEDWKSQYRTISSFPFNTIYKAHPTLYHPTVSMGGVRQATIESINDSQSKNDQYSITCLIFQMLDLLPVLIWVYYNYQKGNANHQKYNSINSTVLMYTLNGQNTF